MVNEAGASLRVSEIVSRPSEGSMVRAKNKSPTVKSGNWEKRAGGIRDARCGRQGKGGGNSAASLESSPMEAQSCQDKATKILEAALP